MGFKLYLGKVQCVEGEKKQRNEDILKKEHQTVGKQCNFKCYLFRGWDYWPSIFVKV